jgi:hypothetical protein
MLENPPLFINSKLLLSIARTAVLILLSISLLGEFVVIAGGYLIFKDYGTTGKLAIGLGAGVEIPCLIFILYALISTQDVFSVLAQHSVIVWIGIIIAFAARFISS